MSFGCSKDSSHRYDSVLLSTHNICFIWEIRRIYFSYVLLSGGLTYIKPRICRGSYIRAHVLSKLLNELGKRDQLQGLSSILSLFRNEFNKLHKTGERLLDSIYHMTIICLCNLIFSVLPYICDVGNSVIS